MWSRERRRCGSSPTATVLDITLGLVMGTVMVTVAVTLSGYDLRLWLTVPTVTTMEMSASAGLTPTSGR